MTLKPDFIILNEIWIMSNEINSYKIEGFDMFTLCNDSYRSGGVVMYIRSADCLQIYCQLDSIDFVLLAVYRLHGSPVAQYRTDVDNLIKAYEGEHLIYTGDINLNILNLDDNTIDSYLSVLASYGVNYLVNEPTRIVGASESCIDHCFVRINPKNKYKTRCIAEVLHLGISDHSMIILRMQYETGVDNKINDGKTNYKLNYTNLEHELSRLEYSLQQ